MASLSAGYFHIFATATDETLFAWGNGNSGQFGDGMGRSSNVPLALTLDGVLTGKRVVAMCAGQFHRLALAEDGMIAGWGANSSGAVGVESRFDQTRPVSVNMVAFAGDRVVGIAAGKDHSLAWTQTGRVFAWGSNTAGQVGTGLPTSAYRLPNPAQVGQTTAFAGEFIKDASGSRVHSLALTQDGRVFAWGGNDRGQLGTGDTSPRPFPTEVQMTGALAGVRVKSIIAGEWHSYALTTDGRVLAWGWNVSGQLGVGNSVASSYVPVQAGVSGPMAGKKVVALATRGHTLALTDDGKLFSWGENPYGQIGNGTTEPVFVPVATDMTGVLAGRRIKQIAVGTGWSAVVTADAQIAVTGPLGETLANGASVTDFGTVQGSATSARTFTIRNIGREPLMIEGTSFTGPDGGNFTVITPPGGTIAPGQSTTTTVLFGPAPAGPRSAALTISSNDLYDGSFLISLAGEAAVPEPAASAVTTTAPLNRQTGLREQTIRITNAADVTVPFYNLIIRGLPESVEVNNASERRADGSWAVYVRQPLDPLSTQDIVLEYFSPNRLPAEIVPVLSTELAAQPLDLSVPGTAAAFRIDSVRSVPGGVMIEFPTTPGLRYQVQYSGDGTNWQASLPAIRAAANRTQWLDRGLPRTDSPPASKPSRFYRVALLP